MKIRKLDSGFSAREVLVTLIVLIGLFAIAFPAYRDYMRRDYYKEVVAATTPFKAAVSRCYLKLKTVTGCNAGTHSIPAAIQKPQGPLASIQVINGVITATPVVWDGIRATDVYVLTPKIINEELTWVPSGDGLTHGYTG